MEDALVGPPCGPLLMGAIDVGPGPGAAKELDIAGFLDGGYKDALSGPPMRLDIEEVIAEGSKGAFTRLPEGLDRRPTDMTDAGYDPLLMGAIDVGPGAPKELDIAGFIDGGYEGP